MTVLPVFIVVFFTVGELFHPSFTSSGKPAVTEVTNAIPKSLSIEKPFVKFAVGTLATMLLEKLLYLDADNRAQCAMSIHNSLTSYRLVNPVLFIVHGGNSSPPPLKIKANSSDQVTLEAFKGTSATSGLLFYEIEHVGHYLMIFWKIQGPQVGSLYEPNRFSTDVTQTLPSTEELLAQTYDSVKKKSDKTKGPNEHLVRQIKVPKDPSRPTVPAFNIEIQAQMTMDKKAKFMVEIKDDLPPLPEADVRKRDVIGTSIALAIIPLGLNLAFKKLKSHIPSQQSCTVALENMCKEEPLTAPSWYITAGETTEIVPWEIKSGEVGEIAFAVPLGGPKIKESFKHTVYFLSYDIGGTGYKMVIGTWFPLKLETKQEPGPSGTPMILQKETPRYTVFIMKAPQRPMKNVLKIIGDILIKSPDEGVFNDQLKLLDGAIYELIPWNSLAQKRKLVVIQVKKLQGYLEWTYPLLAEPVGKSPRREYYIRIVSSMGIGADTGMVVKVQIVPGKSPLTENPHLYKEPPETKDVSTQFPTQDVGVQFPVLKETTEFRGWMKNGGEQFPSRKTNNKGIQLPRA
ncbi:uncharacterized protein LOC114976926 [Acropora millepora]|uniref:uncharacterized protein LOC114976926 n=1 Tax=Acropora millepora TaxID=45264 RepID=UPI001CF19C2E|nr:uncharacterized protein LOC114976926 [Acropora millepora]